MCVSGSGAVDQCDGGGDEECEFWHHREYYIYMSVDEKRAEVLRGLTVSSAIHSC